MEEKVKNRIILLGICLLLIGCGSADSSNAFDVKELEAIGIFFAPNFRCLSYRNESGNRINTYKYYIIHSDGPVAVSPEWEEKSTEKGGCDLSISLMNDRIIRKYKRKYKINKNNCLITRLLYRNVGKTQLTAEIFETTKGYYLTVEILEL